MKSNSLEQYELLPSGAEVPAGTRVPAAVDIRAFLNVHSVAMLGATALALVSGSAVSVSVAGGILFGWLAWRRVLWARRHGARFGYGNALTLGRASILLGTTAAFGVLEPAAVFGLLIANVLLDGLDGVVARRYGECSEFGATFDAEVDALYVMVAGLYFFFSVGWGVWVLIPGALRYVHRVVAWAVAGGDFAERPRRNARLMAGLVFVLLSSAILLRSDLQFYVLIAATATSALSFSVSFLELARHGGDRPSV